MTYYPLNVSPASASASQNLATAFSTAARRPSRAPETASSRARETRADAKSRISAVGKKLDITHSATSIVAAARASDATNVASTVSHASTAVCKHACAVSSKKRRRRVKGAARATGSRRASGRRRARRRGWRRRVRRSVFPSPLVDEPRENPERAPRRLLPHASSARLGRRLVSGFGRSRAERRERRRAQRGGLGGGGVAGGAVGAKTVPVRQVGDGVADQPGRARRRRLVAAQRSGARGAEVQTHARLVVPHAHRCDPTKRRRLRGESLRNTLRRAQPRGAQRRRPPRGFRVGVRDARVGEETERLVRRLFTTFQKTDVRVDVPDKKSIRLVRGRAYRNVFRGFVVVIRRVPRKRERFVRRRRRAPRERARGFVFEKRRREHRDLPVAQPFRSGPGRTLFVVQERSKRVPEERRARGVAERRNERFERLRLEK